MLAHCRQDLSTLGRHRGLVVTMTRRELASRYAGSVAGILWAYLQPLLTVAAYYLVFDMGFAMRMGDGAPTSSVGTYLIVGALPWLFFCETLSRGASSLVESGGMLQKNALPPVLFVARSVMAGWVVFVPLMGLLAIAYTPVSGLSGALFAVPLLLVAQGVVAFLLAYLLAVLAAAVRDTLQVLSFLLSVGIYLSPILFPIALFPQAWRWVLFANPMTALVMGYQSVLLQGEWPLLTTWLVTMGWISVLVLLLDVILRRSRDELVDWL